MFRKTFFASLAGLVVLSGAALAQSYPLAQVQTVTPTDLFPDLVAGSASVPSRYATAAQIAGSPGYNYAGALSGTVTYTFGNSVSNYFGSAASAITLNATTAPNPSDGQRECISITTSTTTLVLAANTGQTVTGGSVSATAGTVHCWTFVGANATWYPSP